MDEFGGELVRRLRDYDDDSNYLLSLLSAAADRIEALEAGTCDSGSQPEAENGEAG